MTSRRIARGVLAVVAVAVVAAAAVWFAARGRAPKAPPAAPRVVVLGIDGVDWEIMQAAVAAGRMPNLGRMINGGASGMLRSIPPYISPSIWTTIATGKLEEKHGIKDFLGERKRAGMSSPTTSNMRQAKALWQVAGERGLTVGFVAWLVTWPPEPVNGYMVSSLFEELARRDERAGMLRPWDDPQTAVHPPELFPALSDLLVRQEDVPDDLVLRFLGTDRHLSRPEVAKGVDDLRRFLASDLTTLEVAKTLLGSVPTDLAGVYFRGLDLACHMFWRHRAPEQWPDGVSAPEVETLGPVIERYYALADSFVGEIAKAAEGAVLIVCSDHGFEGHGARDGGGEPRLGTAMHREGGIIVMAGPGVRAGAAIEGATVLDVTPTVLAILGIPLGRDMDGRALVEALTKEARAERPIAFVATHEGAARHGDAEPIPSPVDDEIKEMLRTLGYIE